MQQQQKALSASWANLQLQELLNGHAKQKEISRNQDVIEKFKTTNSPVARLKVVVFNHHTPIKSTKRKSLEP